MKVIVSCCGGKVVATTRYRPSLPCVCTFRILAGRFGIRCSEPMLPDCTSHHSQPSFVDNASCQTTVHARICRLLILPLPSWANQEYVHSFVPTFHGTKTLQLLIVIRHAQSEGNKNREIHQLIPDHRVKLTDDGWAQVTPLSLPLVPHCMLTTPGRGRRPPSSSLAETGRYAAILHEPV